MGVLVALTVIETAVVHLWLISAGLPVVAWIASLSSLSVALWLAGDACALCRGGIRLGERGLELELGTRGRGRVPYGAIMGIERGAGPAELDLAIAEANVVVTLHSPVELRGRFGRRREAATLALELDEPDAFIAAVRDRA